MKLDWIITFIGFLSLFASFTQESGTSAELSLFWIGVLLCIVALFL